MQLPVLWHGKHCVPDSSAIVTYLTNTFPEEIGPLTPSDPHRCDPDAPNALCTGFTQRASANLYEN